ncbi:MAG: hypothetical protein ABJE66_12075 [Deltaproteobacteria bacterium]
MINLKHCLFAAAIVPLVACTSSPDPVVPGASLTPHVSALQSSVACGDDVAFYGATSPDLRYLYTWDTGGFLTHATGTYAAGGVNDEVSYDWSGDNLVHMLETRAYGDARYELTEAFNGDNLATYAWTTQSADYNDGWTYAYTDYQGPWQPAHETITETGGTPFGYTLAYDTWGRLTTATPESGDPTTYTYDDTALTITSDTGNGTWTDVITYDNQGRELTDAWGGSDPSAIAGDYTFAWDGDSVLAETYRSGTTDAPTTLQTIEVDTLRYDCTMARLAGTGHHARIQRTH